MEEGLYKHKGVNFGMNTLVYSTPKDEIGDRLRKVIEGVVSEGNIEFYRNIDSLSHRLQQPRNNLSVAVLMAKSREELTNILSIRHLLSDIRIILILPDSESDTISKGHSLFPRFLTYANSDFEEVKAVVSKMLETTGQSGMPEAKATKPQ